MNKAKTTRQKKQRHRAMARANRHSSDQSDLFNQPLSQNARSVALTVLTEVLNRKQQLDHIWLFNSEFHALEENDRAFCRLLVMVALRRKGELEHIIQQFVEQMDSLPVRLLYILLIGTTELVFLKKQAYASVHSCVDLVDLPLQKYRKLVNAVLRRISEMAEKYQTDDNGLQSNIPPWLWAQWEQDYGREKSLSMAHACLFEPPTDLYLKQECDKDEWSENLDAILLPSGALRIANGGRVETWHGFEQGKWWVQDAAASLPILLLDSNDVAGKTAIDLCAAPGGKTLQLLDRGAKVTAIDRSAKRLLRLEENCARMGFSQQMAGNIIVADGADYKPQKKADLVLVDAPCSATGTLRRHPEIKYIKNTQDIERLCITQQRLLDQAAQMVGTGGLLIYMTCSLQKTEGEQQIYDFLQRHKGQFSIEIPQQAKQDAYKEFLTKDGFLRLTPDLWPDYGGLDGFFCAYLRAI